MTESKIHLVLSELMGDLSESALAKAINLPKATINRVLSGKTPDPRAGTLIPIAQYFNISIDQLLGISPLPQNTPLEEVAGKNFDIPYIEHEDLIKYMNNEFIPHKNIQISLFNNKQLNDNCFVTKLNSDELSPLFSEGALLIISKSIPQLKNNDIVLIHDNSTNSLMFRKFMIANEMHFLSSPNLNYEIIQLTKEMKVFGIILEGRILT